MKVHEALSLKRGDMVEIYTLDGNDSPTFKKMVVDRIEPIPHSPRDATDVYFDLLKAAKKSLEFIKQNEVTAARVALEAAVSTIPTASVMVFCSDGSKWHNSSLTIVKQVKALAQ